MSHTPFQFQNESKQKYIRDQSNQNKFQNFRNKIKMEARFFLKKKKKDKGNWLRNNSYQACRQTGDIQPGGW